MAGKNGVTIQHSVEIATLYQTGGVSGANLLKMFPQYSKAMIHRHAKKPVNRANHDARKKNKGHPAKLTNQDRRQILRCIPKLRKSEGSFTSR